MDAGLAQARPSTRTLLAKYLSDRPLGHMFTKQQLRNGTGIQDENLGRRMRELRECGWVINTYREDSALHPNEHQLITKGEIP